MATVPGRVLADSGEPPKPLWEKFGLEINNSRGNTPQQNPKLIRSGTENYLLVWEDNRSGYANLFAQKLDDTGKHLWEEEGVAVAPAEGNQNMAVIIGDGKGGMIVAWQDYRSGNADVYAQRIDAQGLPQWEEKGVPVCKAAAGQLAPEIISDGAGGAIITWYDYRGAAGEDVYAQRIDAEGKAVWQKDGMPVCLAAGTQWYPKIVSDRAGGAIIVWTDGRTSSADNSIYAQIISADGQALWEKDGIAVCTALQNQERPVAIAAAGGVIIAWNDWRSGNCDIYAQKLDLAGGSLWPKDGVPVAEAPFSQEDPKLEDDGAGGAIIIWTDSRSEENAIYIQHFSSEGKGLWGDNGRVLAKVDSRQENPTIARLSDGGYITGWEDYQKGKPVLFAQKFNSEGATLWQEGGIPWIELSHEQENLAVVSAPDGASVAAWQDRRQGNFDIYSQKISSDGNLLWGKEGAVACNAVGSVIHQNANLLAGSQGEVTVVFEDARAGYANIYAQKIGRNGTLAWGKDGIAVAKIRGDQSDPQIISDGADGVFVFWEEKKGSDEPRIAGQRLNAAGKKIWENGSVYATKLKCKQSAPRILPDGAGGAIVIWQDERNPLSFKDLYGQRLSSEGELLWDVNGVLICGENGDQTEAEIVSGGGGRFYCAWTDYRRGERNPDVYAQLFDSSGKITWDKEGVVVCGAPDIQRTPRLAADSEGAVVVWTDKGGGSYDIYGQRLNRQGQVLWMRDGIPICQAGRTQQNPVLANSKLVFWEDYRYGNWDVMANSVSPQGQLLWGEGGVPVTVLPLTQYSPQAISLKDGSSVVAWEDYRNNKEYEIFMQKLGLEGERFWQENGFAVITRNGARAPKLASVKGQNALVIIWEDFTSGGRAIYGQKYLLD